MNRKIIDHAQSKFFDLPLIHSKIKNSKRKMYAEPFLGSGATFLNLPRTFDQYLLAECDSTLYNIFYQLTKKTKVGAFSVYADYIFSQFDLSKPAEYDSFEQYFQKFLLYEASRESAFAAILLTMYSMDKKYKPIRPGFKLNCGRFKFDQFETDRVEWTIDWLRSNRYKITLFRDYEEVLYIPGTLMLINPPYYLDKNEKCWTERDTELLMNALSRHDDVIYIDMINPYAEESLAKNLKIGPDFTSADRLLGYKQHMNTDRDPTKVDEYMYANF